MASKEQTNKPKATEAKAIVRYLRTSPQKVRVTIDTIRLQPVHLALRILASMKRKSARQAEKLLKSAVANAKGLGLDENRLIVSSIYADGGPTFKRFMSRSMGRADRILKRTTHLSVILKEGTKSFPGTLTALDEQAEAAAPQKKSKRKLAGKGSGS